MKRREFLKTTAAAALAAGFTKLYGKAAALLPDTGQGAKVFELVNSKEKIQELLGVLFKTDYAKSLSPATASVLIKPNLCLPHNEDFGASTSSALLENLCMELIGRGFKKIIIADHTLGQTHEFADHPVYNIAKTHPEVKILLANEERLYEQVSCEGKVLKTTEALKLARKAELFINAATAKHHSATSVSLCIKNLMGLVWNRTEFHTKLDLHQAIGDLPILFRPHFNIIDASRVLLTGGPTGPGKILEAGKIFGSFDIAAVDSIVASTFNFGNKSHTGTAIAHIKAAFDNGAGEIDPARIERIVL